MARIRALVIEDSSTVRGRIVDVLSADPEVDVVGQAEDGKRGIELCLELRPDVITLDMMLPVMSGLATTEYIMAYCPTPILVVSSSTNRGELFRMYDALAAGAVDVLEKPRGDEPDGVWERKLVSMVKLVSRIKVITHVRARFGHVARARTPIREGPAEARRVVAIGASTGGPGAIAAILNGLPPGFPLPILLVIHIGELFASAFADWLSGQSPMRVEYATDGAALPPVGDGRVIMAPAGRHLILRQGRVRLTDAPPRHSCRPSVDALFESVAREAGAAAVACLLTGMGRDGAEGMLAIRRAGGATIAQDEATSVVFGMPREAIALGAVERVLPLHDIPVALAAAAGVDAMQVRR